MVIPPLLNVTDKLCDYPDHLFLAFWDKARKTPGKISAAPPTIFPGKESKNSKFIREDQTCTNLRVTISRHVLTEKKGVPPPEHGRFPFRTGEKYTPPPWDPSFLGLSPDPEVTEQKKLWCILISWENKGKGYTP